MNEQTAEIAINLVFAIKLFPQIFLPGLDLDCEDFYTDYTLPAIQQGKARESDVDKALRNLYMVLMRLGYFDDIPAYTSLGPSDVCTEENIELAADSARQSIVLLKNENNTLPLDPNIYKDKVLAVVGPHALSHWWMLGNYYGKSQPQLLLQHQ